MSPPTLLIEHQRVLKTLTAELKVTAVDGSEAGLICVLDFKG